MIVSIVISNVVVYMFIKGVVKDCIACCCLHAWCVASIVTLLSWLEKVEWGREVMEGSNTIKNLEGDISMNQWWEKGKMERNRNEKQLKGIEKSIYIYILMY